MNLDRRFSLLYFLYFSCIGILQPYIYIYLEQIGLSKSFIGILAFIGPLAAMVFQFGLGALGDLLGKPRRVIQAAVLLSACLVFGVLWNPHPAWMLVVFPSFYGLQAAIDPLLNAAVMTQEHRDQNRGSFGRRRLWGSLGFVVGVSASGWLIASWGLRFAFPVYAAVMLGLFIPAGGLTGLRQSGIDAVEFLQALGRSLWRPRTRWLVVFLLLWGVPFGGNFVAFGLYWEELGGGFFGLGVAWVLASIFEVPLFWLASRYDEWLNYRWLLVGSSLAAATRWMAYPVLPALWMWYLVQPLHAVMFVGVIVGGVYTMEEVAEPLVRRTGQGILSACIFGLGSALGNLLAGLVYDAYGAPAVYGCLAGFSLTAALVALLGLRQ